MKTLFKFLLAVILFPIYPVWKSLKFLIPAAFILIAFVIYLLWLLAYGRPKRRRRF